jgi:hypothetical protein
MNHRSAQHLLLALLLAAPASTLAQPRENSPNQFGDRQAGQWGDPAQGYFGNPAVGAFDNKQLTEPPPNTRPLGKVYAGEAPAQSPYVTLPSPVETKAAAKPEAAAPAAGNKAARKPRRKKNTEPSRS